MEINNVSQEDEIIRITTKQDLYEILAAENNSFRLEVTPKNKKKNSLNQKQIYELEAGIVDSIRSSLSESLLSLDFIGQSSNTAAQLFPPLNEPISTNQSMQSKNGTIISGEGRIQSDSSQSKVASSPNTITSLADIVKAQNQKSKSAINVRRVSFNRQKVLAPSVTEQPLALNNNISQVFAEQEESFVEQFPLDRFDLPRRQTMPLNRKQKTIQEEVHRLKKENSQLRDQMSSPHKHTSHNYSKSSQIDVKDYDNEIQVCFAFASPLLQYLGLNERREQNVMIFEQLRFEQEYQYIRKAAQKSGKQIKLWRAPATRHSFESMLSRKPRGLHFFGHAVQNTKATFGTEFQKKYEEDGDSLLFESKLGSGEVDFVSQKELKEYVACYSVNFDFVFVASCHSEFAGKIFSAAGAKHVICVKYESKVEENSVLQFTKTFYEELFSGETVCDAFRTAKKSVSLAIPKYYQNDKQIENEKEYKASQFKLFLPNQEDSLGDGFVCKNGGCQSSFVYLKPGKCVSFGEKKSCPANMRNPPDFPMHFQCPEFQTNRIQTNQLLHLMLVQKKRLITVYGPPGIGKSSLVKYTFQFVKQRNYFLAGITMLPIKCSNSVCRLLYTLFNHYADADTITSISSIMEVQSTEQKIKQLAQIMRGKTNKDHRMLLCLDNAEDLLQSHNLEIKKFLDRLLGQLPNLTVIITSRPLNCFLDDVQGDIIDSYMCVKPLSDHETVALFLKHSKDKTSSEEIISLLECQSNYPYEKINIHTSGIIYDGSNKKLNNETRKKLIRRLSENEDFVIHCLAHHEMFKLLKGNPHSITVMASLKNPTQQIQSIYKLLKGNNMDEQMAEEGVRDGNLISLRLSSAAIVKFLEDAKEIQALDLLFFLGMLPGGASENLLDEIWRSGKESWRHGVEILKKYHLFDNLIAKDGSNHYQLKAYMISYTQATIDKDTKADFIQLIFDYYAHKLESKNALYFKSLLSDESGDKFQNMPNDCLYNISFCLKHITKQKPHKDHQQKISHMSVQINRGSEEEPEDYWEKYSYQNKQVPILERTLESELSSNRMSKLKSPHGSFRVQRQISEIKGIGKTITLAQNSDCTDSDFEREDEDELSEKQSIQSELGTKKKFSSTHDSVKRGNVGMKPMFINVHSGSSDESDEVKPFELADNRKLQMTTSRSAKKPFPRVSNDFNGSLVHRFSKKNIKMIDQCAKKAKLRKHILNPSMRSSFFASGVSHEIQVNKKRMSGSLSQSFLSPKKGTLTNKIYSPGQNFNFNIGKKSSSDETEKNSLQSQCGPKDRFILYLASCAIITKDWTVCEKIFSMPPERLAVPHYLFEANLRRLKAIYLEKSPIEYCDEPIPKIRKERVFQAAYDLQLAAITFGLFKFIATLNLDNDVELSQVFNQFQGQNVTDDNFCLNGLAYTLLYLGYLQFEYIEKPSKSSNSQKAMREIQIFLKFPFFPNQVLLVALKAFTQLHCHQGMYATTRLLYQSYSDTYKKTGKNKEKMLIYEEETQKQKQLAIKQLESVNQKLPQFEKLLESLFIKLVLNEHENWPQSSCECGLVALSSPKVSKEKDITMQEPQKEELVKPGLKTDNDVVKKSQNNQEESQTSETVETYIPGTTFGVATLRQNENLRLKNVFTQEKQNKKLKSQPGNEFQLGKSFNFRRQHSFAPSFEISTPQPASPELTEVTSPSPYEDNYIHIVDQTQQPEEDYIPSYDSTQGISPIRSLKKGASVTISATSLWSERSSRLKNASFYTPYKMSSNRGFNTSIKRKNSEEKLKQRKLQSALRSVMKK